MGGPELEDSREWSTVGGVKRKDWNMSGVERVSWWSGRRGVEGAEWEERSWRSRVGEVEVMVGGGQEGVRRKGW